MAPQFSQHGPSKYKPKPHSHTHVSLSNTFIPISAFYSPSPICHHMHVLCVLAHASDLFPLEILPSFIHLFKTQSELHLIQEHLLHLAPLSTSHSLNIHLPLNPTNIVCTTIWNSPETPLYTYLLICGSSYPQLDYGFLVSRK